MVCVCVCMRVCEKGLMVCVCVCVVSVCMCGVCMCVLCFPWSEIRKRVLLCCTCRSVSLRGQARFLQTFFFFRRMGGRGGGLCYS